MSNPLAKHFRQPAIHMELPSAGRWWRPGSLSVPPTNQLPIFPMTARDEILIRTPDALMNGSTVVELLQNCVPSIKDAWATPNVDIDALLIGIRIASYGPNLDVDTTCPHCGHANRHEFDLTHRLGSIRCPNFDKSIAHNGLTYKFKPMNYFSTTRENTVAFHEEKLIAALENAELGEEEKQKQLKESITNLTNANVKSITSQTEYIQMADGTKVVEFEYIHEFYQNVEADVLRHILSKIKEIYSDVAVPDEKVQCVECTKEYSVPFQFDYSSFFVRGF